LRIIYYDSEIDGYLVNEINYIAYTNDLYEELPEGEEVEIEKEESFSIFSSITERFSENSEEVSLTEGLCIMDKDEQILVFPNIDKDTCNSMIKEIYETGKLDLSKYSDWEYVD
jgi:hypothetical protein